MYLSNLTFKGLSNHPTVEELHKNGGLSCSKHHSLHLTSLNFTLLPTQKKSLSVIPFFVKFTLQSRKRKKKEAF